MNKGWILKFSRALASLALMVGVTATTQGCLLWYHQPEIPKGMKKFISKF